MAGTESQARVQEPASSCVCAHIRSRKGNNDEGSDGGVDLEKDVDSGGDNSLRCFTVTNDDGGGEEEEIKSPFSLTGDNL